jgi:hypothetical protein
MPQGCIPCERSAQTKCQSQPMIRLIELSRMNQKTAEYIIQVLKGLYTTAQLNS